ncbi:MAG: hypothetical protein JKY47_09895 [Thalassospira sp.]|nr:hypothetical protein [Thalassospira sp.]PCI28698.1 MAG: hypothetical protein COB52_03300 [Candidatus Kaiserbacteria bacterium]
MNNLNKDNHISQEVVDLVVARLKSMPENVAISIGGTSETFTTKEMIRNVEERNEFGHTMVKVQMNYLRSLQDLNTLSFL